MRKCTSVRCKEAIKILYKRKQLIADKVKWREQEILIMHSDNSLVFTYTACRSNRRCTLGMRTTARTESAFPTYDRC